MESPSIDAPPRRCDTSPITAHAPPASGEAKQHDSSSGSGKDEPHHRYREAQETALQKHVAFFDGNKDGIITWMETFRGFRSLGFNLAAAVYAATVIHVFMSYATADSWWPTFSIRIRNIHRARHGSDTQVYDEQGYFSENKFQTMMQRYDTDGDGFLTRRELMAMILTQRSAFDLFGWCAECLEWGFFWFLVRQPIPSRPGFLGVKHEHIRGQFDGSLFYAIAAERAVKADKEKLARSGSRAGASAPPQHLPMPEKHS